MSDSNERGCADFLSDLFDVACFLLLCWAVYQLHDNSKEIERRLNDSECQRVALEERLAVLEGQR